MQSLKPGTESQVKGKRQSKKIAWAEGLTLILKQEVRGGVGGC